MSDICISILKRLPFKDAVKDIISETKQLIGPELVLIIMRADNYKIPSCKNNCCGFVFFLLLCHWSRFILIRVTRDISPFLI